MRKNAKFTVNQFYMNTNQWKDLQMYTSVHCFFYLFVFIIFISITRLKKLHCIKHEVFHEEYLQSM